MPTLGAHFPDSESELIKLAAKDSPDGKPGPYIRRAVLSRLAQEGRLPGPQEDVRTEALAVSKIIGADRVLRLLREEKARAAADKVELLHAPQPDLAATG